MGEEAKQEPAAAAEEAKPAAEEKKEEPPKPPPPFVLFMDLHCVGCAKKIERSLLKLKGVEGVQIDMDKNQVKIKGVIEPQAVCNKIMKKTKRIAQILSPLPPAEGQPIPQLVTSQVSGLTTVELNVNMHCEACAHQLKKKILKMRGVQTVESELSNMKVAVTGTMDAQKLVDYVYRRTKKQAQIIPLFEPEKPPEEPKTEEKTESEKQAEESKAEDKDQNAEQKPPVDAPKEGGAENKSPENKEEPKKDDGGVGDGGGDTGSSGGGGNDGGGGGGREDSSSNNNNNDNKNNIDEESMKRMMYYYQPVYAMERIPPPQLFSDENPNACCIS